MDKIRLNKKGITVAEVVIAMAVVAFVTVSTLSFVLTSTLGTQKAVFRSEAQHFAANALACFRAAGNAAEFEAAMAFSGGYSECTRHDAEAVFVYEFTLENSGYSAIVYIDYRKAESSAFSVAVRDTDDEDVTEISFTRGEP